MKILEDKNKILLDGHEVEALRRDYLAGSKRVGIFIPHFAIQKKNLTGLTEIAEHAWSKLMVSGHLRRLV